MNGQKYKPQKQETNIGALWMRNSRSNGEEYLLGRIEIDGVRHEIIAFKNKHKSSVTHPDFIIKRQEENYATNTSENERDNF